MGSGCLTGGWDGFAKVGRGIHLEGLFQGFGVGGVEGLR